MHPEPLIPLQITFRDLEKSEALDARIRDQVDKLGQFYSGIHSCRVTVEKLHKHQRQGNHFHVRIDIKTTEHELVAGREPDQHHAYTDVYVAVRDVFKAMRRQLEDLVQKQQGQVKHPAQRPHGHIMEISADKTCGRIESSDGRWLYFHRNSLIGEDLDQLNEGTPVYFIEDMGDEGPHARSVYPMGKHHILV